MEDTATAALAMAMADEGGAWRECEAGCGGGEEEEDGSELHFIWMSE